MLSSTLSRVADFISGTVPGASTLDPFSFAADIIDAPYDQLPGFDDSIGEPSMRKCCALGWDASASIPLIPDMPTKPMEIGDLYNSEHKYGGPAIYEISKDSVGHLYSARGGILDLGHIRDHADLTRYLAVNARKKLKEGGTVMLSGEGSASTRTVKFTQAYTEPTPRVAATVGARISYELSIWHEIVTWAAQNASFPTKQEYSAFSPEDNFSNLLGAFLGYKAILQPLTEFNAAMRLAVSQAAFSLRPVPEATTIEAIDYVRDRWFQYPEDWNGIVRMELLRRHFDALGTVTPWLIQTITIPDKSAVLEQLIKDTHGETQPRSITVPENTHTGYPLSSLYSLEFNVNASEFFDGFLDSIPNPVTAQHFPTLIQRVRADVLQRYPEGHLP